MSRVSVALLLTPPSRLSPPIPLHHLTFLQVSPKSLAIVVHYAAPTPLNSLVLTWLTVSNLPSITISIYIELPPCSVHGRVLEIGLLAGRRLCVNFLLSHSFPFILNFHLVPFMGGC